MTTRRLADAIDRRPGRIVLVAIVLFAIAAPLGASVTDRLDPYSAADPATQSIRAKNELERAGYRPPSVFVIVRDAPVGGRSTRARVESLERRLRRRRDVSSVSGYYDTGSRDFVSFDGRSMYFTVALHPTGDRRVQEIGRDIAASLARTRGVLVGGPAVALAQTNAQIEKDLRAAELLAFPLLFLLSLFFFRGLVAAVLPLVTGALAIAGTYLILSLLSRLTSISIFALNLTTGLGLGLAIDYSLFIVSRYREEIAKDGPGTQAMARVLGTAGRTVAFSALIVSVSLAALLVFPQRFLYSMGLGGSLVVLLAALIALTVLPAILTLLGARVDALAPVFLHRRAAADATPDPRGVWFRLARRIMRRPLLVASACSAALIVLGLPFQRVIFNTVNPTALPKAASARRAYEVVNTQFPPYRATPFLLAVSGGGPGAASRLAGPVRRTPGIATVEGPRRLAGGTRLLIAVSTSALNSVASQGTVSRLRAIHPPSGATVLVGGESAEFVDFKASLVRHLPYALAIIVIATFTVLLAMTRSVTLPMKALMMNALNLSAVFGILVLIFQDGRLEAVLNYRSNGSLEQTMPILLVAVVFGLSTDYAVFLLSRIKEAHDAGFSNSDAVAIGLERTGRIVTAAALLFAVAMFAFATSEIAFIKENGIGAALAVLIDASVVRCLLVPALMALLGDWNWWTPRVIRRPVWEREP